MNAREVNLKKNALRFLIMTIISKSNKMIFFIISDMHIKGKRTSECTAPGEVFVNSERPTAGPVHRHPFPINANNTANSIATTPRTFNERWIWKANGVLSPQANRAAAYELSVNSDYLLNSADWYWKHRLVEFSTGNRSPPTGWNKRRMEIEPTESIQKVEFKAIPIITSPVSPFGSHGRDHTASVTYT